MHSRILVSTEDIPVRAPRVSTYFYGTSICLSAPEALKTSGEHRETQALSHH